MKNIKKEKIGILLAPFAAMFGGLVIGYGSIFYAPLRNGFTILARNGAPLELIFIITQYIGFIAAGLACILLLASEIEKRSSYYLALFGLTYLASLAYFGNTILYIITNL